MPGQSIDEEAVFNVARKIESREAREDYLEQICGKDTALKARVIALLDAVVQDSEFMNVPPSGVEATIDSAPICEQVGTVIGKYKLMEQIGEGGMGLVFVAEQKRPIKRKVAIKIIKPGMDSREVIARFEAERQALALMDHPNVAKVLDAGTTDSGRPYFVMELVKGIPITDYCDRFKLTTSQRLSLFVTVCEALQHAHQKGIIHRDIKPSNVLVTEHDGRPVVKIIDFGVAKAINQRLTEQTIYTRFQQLVGTPLYMSPEQAELSGLDVDTRSDIYSLGVLLYELLTGQPVFEKQRFCEAAFDEMRRIIREEEPHWPSTRISTLGETATDVSNQRQTDPGRLAQLLRGEIDWIVMKALDKDRARRYDSASSFAEDIERYLNNETVSAYPPTWTYRLRKVIRRNRGPVIAATLLALAVTGGLIGTSMGLLRARSAAISERQAWQEKENALSQAAEAKENERALELSNQFSLATSDALTGTALMGQRDSAGLHWLVRSYLRLPNEAALRQKLEAQIIQGITETPQLVAAWTNEHDTVTRVLQTRPANSPDLAVAVVETRGDNGRTTLSSLQPIDLVSGKPTGAVIRGHFDGALHRSFNGNVLVTVDAIAEGDGRLVRFWNSVTGMETAPSFMIDADSVVLGVLGDSSLVLAKDEENLEFKVWAVENGRENPIEPVTLAFPGRMPESWKNRTRLLAYPASADRLVAHFERYAERAEYLISVEGDRLRADLIEDATSVLVSEENQRLIKLERERNSSEGSSRPERDKLLVQLEAITAGGESGEGFGVPLQWSGAVANYAADASQRRFLFTQTRDGVFDPSGWKRWINVVDLAEKRVVLSVTADPLQSIARLSSDGLLLAVVQPSQSVTSSNEISIYDVDSETRENTYRKVHVSEDVTSLHISPDNRYLTAYTKSGGRSWLLPNATCSPSLRLPVERALSTDLVFDETGKLLFCERTNRKPDGVFETAIAVFDVASKALIQEHNLGAIVSDNLGEFDEPSTHYVAVNKLASKVSLWNCSTGKPVMPELKTEEGVNAATLSPDRGTLITLAFPLLDKKPVSALEVWDVPSGTRRQVARVEYLFHRGFSRMGWIRFSAAGDAVFVGGGDGFLKIPFREGTLIESETRRAEGDVRMVGAIGNTQKPVAVASVGKWLLLASDDALRRWDSETLRPVTTYQEKNDSIGLRKCRISPDGSQIAFEWGRAVKLWDAESGQLLQTLFHPARVQDLRFSPDGKHLATSCVDGIVRLWPLDLAQPLKAAELPDVVARATGFQLSDDGDELEPVDAVVDDRLVEVGQTGNSLLDQAVGRSYAHEWEAARYLLTEMIRREPHNRIAYLLRASARHHLGDQSAAEQDVKRAVAEAKKAGDLPYLLQWAKWCDFDEELNALIDRQAKLD